MNDYIYEVKFTDDVWDSAYSTISIHRTLSGAYKALRKRIEDGYSLWYEQRMIHGKYITDANFGWNMSWRIKKTKIED